MIDSKIIQKNRSTAFKLADGLTGYDLFLAGVSEGRSEQRGEENATCRRLVYAMRNMPLEYGPTLIHDVVRYMIGGSTPEVAIDKALDAYDNGGGK